MDVLPLVATSLGVFLLGLACAALGRPEPSYGIVTSGLSRRILQLLANTRHNSSMKMSHRNDLPANRHFKRKLKFIQGEQTDRTPPVFSCPVKKDHRNQVETIYQTQTWQRESYDSFVTTLGSLPSSPASMQQRVSKQTSNSFYSSPRINSHLHQTSMSLPHLLPTISANPTS